VCVQYIYFAPREKLKRRVKQVMVKKKKTKL